MSITNNPTTVHIVPTILSKPLVSTNILVCDDCNKTYDKTKKFSIYDKNFCSIKCLQKYKTIEDNKRNPKSDKCNSHPKYNYGSSSGCC